MKNFYEISFKFCNQQWIIRQKKCGFSSYYSVKRTGESGVGISLNTWKNRLMEKGSYNQFLSRKDSRCRAGDWRNKEMRSRLDRILVVYGFLMKRPGISIQKTSCVFTLFYISFRGCGALSTWCDSICLPALTLWSSSWTATNKPFWKCWGRRRSWRQQNQRRRT